MTCHPISFQNPPETLEGYGGGPPPEGSLPPPPYGGLQKTPKPDLKKYLELKFQPPTADPEDKPHG